MLTIKFWCLPKLKQKCLEALFKRTLKEVASCRAFHKAGYVDEKTILVLFPKDSMKLGLGAEILIEVDGLRNGIECMHRQRLELAQKLKDMTRKHLPFAKAVICRVKPYDPDLVEV